MTSQKTIDVPDIPEQGPVEPFMVDKDWWKSKTIKEKHDIIGGIAKYDASKMFYIRKLYD